MCLNKIWKTIPDHFRYEKIKLFVRKYILNSYRHTAGLREPRFDRRVY